MAMRRSVFLAVWLGLVLSLLKASSTATEETSVSTVATSSVTSASSTTTGETSVPTVTTSSESSASSTTTGETSVPTVTTSSVTSASSTTTGETSVPTVTTSSVTSASSTTTGETSVPTVTTSSETSASSTTTGETSVPTVTTSSETSASSTTTGETSVPTVTTSPATSVDFCSEDPCGQNSATCISLNSGYTCECQYGFYYSNENCHRGKVFPATIAVNTGYTDSLLNVHSAEYEAMFNMLSQFFGEALGNQNLSYVETVIAKIRPSSKSRNSVPVYVSVANLFMLNSSADNATVDSAIRAAIDSGNYSYVNSSLGAKYCDIYQCDDKTTVCEENGELPECRCKHDLAKTEWDDRSCSACNETCSAEAKKYCVKEEGVPACKCMPNFKNESGNCVACSLGYSGEECTDDTELILIIVGTVLGAIILILVIAVSVISVRAKNKRNPEKRSLIKSGYSDMNTSDDRPSMFPRVQTTSGHANPGYQPNNPYEMRSNNRDRFPERDYDDLYDISREPRGFRTQSRY
ncbi:mucin-13 [Acridotheres tristis]